MNIIRVSFLGNEGTFMESYEAHDSVMMKGEGVHSCLLSDEEVEEATR